MSTGSSSTPTRKNPPSPSKLTNDPAQHVELKDMASEGQGISAEEDIMLLARLGEIRAIQKLLDSGKFDATYADDQGVTPLHWAAINNHYALCHFLIESGANVNAKGGEAAATPLLWAATRCHYYVVNLLIQRGADPLITDDQGYNALHSATFDGNAFQLVFLLHQDLPVDIPDRAGHTSLMWAVYHGFPVCVDLLLRWGASVDAKDDEGNTALHWAVIRGSQSCIQKLVEFGSDRFATNNEGKTCEVLAHDMNTERQWHKALKACSYNPDASPIQFPLASWVKDRRAFFSQTFFLLPFIMLLSVLYLFSAFSIIISIPLAIVIFWAIPMLAEKCLRWAPSDMKTVHKTPILAGLFAGSLFWVGVRYLTHILLWTFWSNIFLNLTFIVSFGFCTYFYVRTMLEDPGFVPKLGSRQAQKTVIEELMDAQTFDEKHFCTHCMTRKPIRSKHCKPCGRCVAKTDHHCPWVNNHVAVNNHRHFVLYLLAMEVGIVAFVWLVIAYLHNIEKPNGVHCNILADEFCEELMKDPFTIYLTWWTAVVLLWTTMLTSVQLLQIGRALTTIESIRGFAGDGITSFVTTGSISAEGGEITGSGSGPDATNRPPHHKHGGAWQTWKRLLGLETFVAIALHGSNAPAVQAQAERNPYQRGIVTNCKDFWCDPAPIFGRRETGMALLGGDRINYTRLYEMPTRTRMHRERQGPEEEERLVTNSEEV